MTLASGSSDNTVRLWDMATQKEKNTLTRHSGTIRTIAFSPDGTSLASASWDYTARLWDVTTGQLKPP